MQIDGGCDNFTLSFVVLLTKWRIILIDFDKMA